MNYRQVEIFCAIIERASITEAAQHLGLSQPAVSKSLKLLELQLGLRLFNRTTRGLHATDEARELYTEAQRVMQGFAHFGAFAHNLHKLEHARLVVGVMPALSTNWLSRVVAAFTDDYPEVSLVLRATGSANVVKSVAHGEIDIGVGQVRTDDPAISKRKLYDLHVMCAVPVDHRLASKDAIDPEDLHQEAIVLLSAQDEFRRMLDGKLLSKGVALTSRIEASHSLMICSLVAERRGIGIIDNETASHGSWPGISFKPFNPILRTPIYLMRNNHNPQSFASKKFYEYIGKFKAG